MKPYCTYKSTHSSGLFYIGKGKTALVAAGKYKGSGTRFKLALTLPEFAWDTWTTVTLETFTTEEEAYAAEAALVPLSLLANPLCVNQQSGGKCGRFQNHAALRRKLTKEEKERKAQLRLSKKSTRSLTSAKISKAKRTARSK